MTASARRPDGKPGTRPAGAAGERSGRAEGSRQLQVQRQRAGGAGRMLGASVARNPVSLGGSIAFAVALSFVSANAIWGQSESHAGAFFPTRALPSGWSGDPDTTGAIGRAAPRPTPDPTLRLVQAELRRIGLYDVPADGLPGPGTRKAVAAFQARNGLKATGEIDGAFLSLLAEQADAGQPNAGPADAGQAGRDADRVASAAAEIPAATDRGRIEKVQAGLKAFGIDGVDVDGLMGARTRAGIREFQSMFGLPQTGEPDDALLARMQETGLAN